MASKFNIVIKISKTCRRKISILNTKYLIPNTKFENFRVRKNDIMITKISKNNSNKSNNEYYNITWKAYLRNSYYEYKLARNLVRRNNSFSVFRIISFRMSSEYLPLVLDALEKDTKIHNPEPSLLKVKPFGGVSDFSYKGFQIHIFFVSLRNFDIVNFQFS